MRLGGHQLRPLDGLREAQVPILEDGHRAGANRLQRAQPQRLQTGLDDVEGAEVLGQLAAADALQVAEEGEVGEVGVVGLDVDEAGHLAEGAEDLQLGGRHRRVARAEGEVGVHLLEALEARLEDGQRALDDGAALEGVDVVGVDDVHALAVLWTRAIAGNALAVDRLLIGGTGADAGAVVLQQVLGAVLDAGGAVGVLALGIDLPGVGGRVVAHHRRTLLLADAVVVEVAACLSG